MASSSSSSTSTARTSFSRMETDDDHATVEPSPRPRKQRRLIEPKPSYDDASPPSEDEASPVAVRTSTAVPTALLAKMNCSQKEFLRFTAEVRFEKLNTALHAVFPTNPREPDVVAEEHYRAEETEEVLDFLLGRSLGRLFDEEYADIFTSCWCPKISRLVKACSAGTPPPAPAKTAQKKGKKSKKQKLTPPDVYICSLNIRVGEPRTTLRKITKLEVPSWDYKMDAALDDLEAFEILRSQISSRLRQFKGYVWPTDASIYFAPFSTTTQANLVELSDENFLEQFDNSFQNATVRRRTAGEGFLLPLWVYLQSTTPTQATGPKTQIVRRATTKRCVAAAKRITEQLQQPGMEELQRTVGPLAKKHWSLRVARGPELELDQPLQPPTTNTFGQMIFLDGERQKLNRRQAENEESDAAIYKTIHVLHNGVRVPYLMDVKDLRTALGLPNMNLMGLGEMETNEPNTPIDDMDDHDHVDTDNEG